MKVLVINSGSSSLKFTLFSMTNKTVLAKGLVERIGMKNPHLIYHPGNNPKFQTRDDDDNADDDTDDTTSTDGQLT